MIYIVFFKNYFQVRIIEYDSIIHRRGIIPLTNVDSLLLRWERHRSVTQEIFQMMKNEHLHFQAWEKGMSIQTLALHMAISAHMFVKSIHMKEFLPPDPNELPDIQTMQELNRFFFDMTEKTKDIFISLTEEDLEKEIDVTRMLGRNISGKSMLHILLEHEIHHKGQLFVYARILGLDPLPLFMKNER